MRQILLSITLLLYIGIASADPAPTTDELMSEIRLLREQLNNIESQIEDNTTQNSKKEFYTPLLYGSMISYFNYLPESGQNRFALRNAHVGVTGNASNNVSYVVHVNFGNFGTITPLEMNVKYTYKTFNVILGQQCTMITTEFDRCGPLGIIFTSRSYGVLFIPRYSTDSYVGHMTVGDTGIYGTYKFDWEVPITLSLGAFNGLGLNQLEWDNDINTTARVQIGRNRGLAAAASLYTGTSPIDQPLTIWSGELKYETDNLFIETNYQQRRLDYGDGQPLAITQTGILHSYYTFRTPNSRLFDNYQPALRYDFATNIDYLNVATERVEHYDVSRATALMHFNLKGTKIRSRLSIGYEKIFMREKPSDIAANELFQDRFLVAMTIGFFSKK